MEHTSDLARLETCIDTLLGRYTQLKAEHTALQHTLREREQEIRRLEQEAAQYFSEREEIGGRIARLLGRIEHWQQEEPPADPEGQPEDRA